MGAPEYSPQRIAEIERLAGTMPVGKIAQTIGMSRDALRIWCRRHGVSLKLRQPAPEQKPGNEMAASP
jgi:hypothetical protein